MSLRRLTLLIVPAFFAVLLAALPSLSAQDADAPRSDALSDLRKLETDIVACAAKVRDAVAGLRVGMSSGSGTFISADGWIATVAHVTKGTPGKAVTVFLADGTKLEGVTCGIHAPMDYGLVKVDPGERTLPFVELGHSSALSAGQWVVAMGHPGGYEQERKPVVRAGRVLRPDNGRGMVVIDAPLIGGDSGGPVFTLEGKLVAINQSINTIDVTVNNVTPIDGYRRVMDAMKANRVLGRERGIGSGGGVEADEASTDLDETASERMQWAITLLRQKKYERAGRILKRLTAEESAHPSALYNAACAESLWSRESGDDAEAHTSRAVELLRRSVEAGWNDYDHTLRDSDLDPLRERADFLEFLAAFAAKIRRPVLGLRVEGAEKSIRVSEVLERSLAFAAGIRVGDVVVSVDGQAIFDLAAFANAISTADLSRTTRIVLRREGREIEAIVELGRSGPDAQAVILARREYKNGDNWLGRWRETLGPLRGAVFGLAVDENGGRRGVGYATAISKNGYLLAKHSELGEFPLHIIDDDGGAIAVSIAATDEELDLALLKAERDFEHFVVFAKDTAFPALGGFLATVDADGAPMTQGVVALEPYNSSASGKNLQGAFLGINADNVEQGIKITSVSDGSPAAKAGLRVGDVLLKIDDKEVKSFDFIARLMKSLNPGDEVEFTVRREESEVAERIKVKLGSRLDIFKQMAKARLEELRGKRPKPRLGATLEVADGGVRLLQVRAGGAAEAGGLWEEDVIVSIDGAAVTTLDELQKILVEAPAGAVLKVALLRDGETIEKTVTLSGSDEDAESEWDDLLEQRFFGRGKGPQSTRAMNFGDVIEHDGVIAPNQTGGPVVDLLGGVVGLNISRTDRIRTFALPSARVAAALEKMLEKVGK